MTSWRIWLWRVVTGNCDPGYGGAPAIGTPDVTFQGTYQHGIVLSDPATQNPATIAASGYVTNTGKAHGGTAVYGNDAAPWSLTNLGTVIGRSLPAADGVYLAQGSVVNGESSSAAGLIAGAYHGVQIKSGGAAAVINFGTIEALGSTIVAGTLIAGSGVELDAGGSIGNYGLISGALAGVRNRVGTVTNFGTIEANRSIVGVGGAVIGGDGVDLGVGTVVNGYSGANSGLILGYQNGVSALGAATVSNFGTIAAGGLLGRGVELAAGGSLANYGTIEAAHGIAVGLGPGGAIANSGLIAGAARGINVNAAATLINLGTIEGSAPNLGIAVYLGAGAIVNAAGLISGDYNGIKTGTLGPGDIVNYGTIAALGSLAYSITAGTALFIEAGGSIANGGLIEGQRYGVLMNGGSVANFGTIEALGSVRGAGGTVLGGNGVYLSAGFVDNGGSAAAGLIAGYRDGVRIGLSGRGTVLNYGTIESRAVAAGSALAVGLELDAGGLIVNSGTILAAGLGVFLGGGGSTVLNAGVIGGSGAALSFGNGNDLLVLEPGAVITGAIARFQPLETIDLAGVVATGASFDAAGGVLTVVDGAAVVATLALAGHFTSQEFALASDGADGTAITLRQPSRPVISGVYYDTLLLGQGGVGSSATVTARGTIDAAFGHGVRAIGGPVSLGNAGTITAGENPATGIYAAENSGAVVLAAGDGVYLDAGGIITNGGNGGGGLIAGFAAGVAIGGGSSTVINSGTISGTGTAAVGIRLGTAVLSGAATAHGFGQTLTNYGTVSGVTGIIASGSDATITNAGMIVGSGGTAVMLADGGDRLIVEPGAAFYGIADGGGGSVLELAGYAAVLGGRGAPSIGTLAGIGSSFVNFGTLVVDPGASWEASGDASQYPFLNDGTVIVSNGIVAGGETLVFGMLAEDAGARGFVEVGGGGTAVFAGAVAKGQTVVFTDASASIQLVDPTAFAARISGFQSGDVIDLVGVAADSFTYAKGRLRLIEGGQTVAVLAFAGHYTKAEFQLGADGNGGTEIMLAAASAAGREFPPALGPPAFWVSAYG